MGRVATATAILEARGAFDNHPERRRPREPKAGGIGSAPRSLSEKEAAVWDETVAMCAPGVFQSSDRHLLALYCKLWCGYQEKGEAYPVRRLTMLIQLASRFGMSPADRARIHVEPKRDAKKTGLAAFVD